jgi:hypothetical protein
MRLLGTLFVIVSMVSTAFAGQTADQIIRILQAPQVRSMLQTDKVLGSLTAVKYLFSEYTAEGAAMYALVFKKNNEDGTLLCEITVRVGNEVKILDGMECAEEPTGFKFH